MNDHTIQLVRESFDLVEPIASQAAALFYVNLFATDPSVKPLFRGDMIKQPLLNFEWVSWRRFGHRSKEVR